MIIKSKALFIWTAGVSMLLFLSCNKESRWDCFKGTGKRATEARTVPAFNKIYLKGNVDVYIKQGTAQEVMIEGGENLIGLITTDVDSGILHIDNENKCNWARSYKKGTLNVFITLPTLRFIWHYGSGMIMAADTITCDTLDIWTHQTGNAELTLKANIIYTNMHTNADLTLHGTTNILGCWHTGEGYMHCEDLLADIAWVHTKASGNDYVNVKTDLAATIEWEGSVYYLGDPAVLRKGDGKGELIKLN